jgi:hypothetical protein
VAKRRISVTARNIIVVAHPISSHFTHWVILVLRIEVKIVIILI